MEIVFGSLIFFFLVAIVLFWSEVEVWPLAFGLLLLERLMVLVVMAQVFLTKLLVIITQQRTFAQAKEKLNQTKNLKIIGVTGSYGKTSTKDFIAQLLASKYRVVWTSGTNNTKIGIAQNICQKLKKETEILVVEMGAYKKGEIADICRLVPPHIAIVTGINQQHLSLFGTLGNLIEAKYEIVENLSPEGLAIFNASNQRTLKMAKKASLKFKTALYQLGKPGKGTNFTQCLWADAYVEDGKGISFKVHLPKELNLKTNLREKHNVENMMAAIVVARHLGLSGDQIKKAVADLKVSSWGLRIVKKSRETIVIDDTFSSNPRGFLSALDFLRQFKDRKKIVITPGIIELGEASNLVHEKIGQAIGSLAEVVILTNDNFLDPIQKGMGEDRKKVMVESKPEKITALVKEGSPSVVLLEGRLPANILRAFNLK